LARLVPLPGAAFLTTGLGRVHYVDVGAYRIRGTRAALLA
jgi:hypothetical protein